jgi:hypothetical protein
MISENLLNMVRSSFPSRPAEASQHDSLSMERVVRHLARHGIAAGADEALQR